MVEMGWLARLARGDGSDGVAVAARYGGYDGRGRERRGVRGRV